MCLFSLSLRKKNRNTRIHTIDWLERGMDPPTCSISAPSRRCSTEDGITPLCMIWSFGNIAVTPHHQQDTSSQIKATPTHTDVVGLMYFFFSLVKEDDGGGRDCFPFRIAYLHFELRHISFFFFRPNLSQMAFEPRGPVLFNISFFFSPLLDGSQNIHMNVCTCILGEGVGGEENILFTHTPKARAPAILSKARICKLDRHNPIRWWLCVCCGVGIDVCVCSCWPTFGGIRSPGRWNNPLR